MNIGKILIWESSYDAVFRFRCADAALCLGFAFSMLCLSANQTVLTILNNLLNGLGMDGLTY